MAYEVNDIQFSDDALGLGRALRLTAESNVRCSFSQDSDNADITIVTFEPSDNESVNRVIKTADFEVGRIGDIQAPLYIIDATAGDIIVTMPLTAANDKRYSFMRIDESANNVTFVGIIGTEKFSGSSSMNIFYPEAFELFTDYANWFILN